MPAESRYAGVDELPASGSTLMHTCTIHHLYKYYRIQYAIWPKRTVLCTYKPNKKVVIITCSCLNPTCKRHWSIQYFLCPHVPVIRQDATGCQWPLRPMDVMAMLHNTTSPEASAVARVAPYIPIAVVSCEKHATYGPLRACTKKGPGYRTWDPLKTRGQCLRKKY